MLRGMPEVLGYSSDDRGKKQVHLERIPDVIYAAGNEEDYLLLMDENQQQTDFSMPLRNMLNTALAYMQQKKQIEELHRQRHDLKSGSEYLSGFAEQDRLHPVICIIFYHGEIPWEGGTSPVSYTHLDVYKRQSSDKGEKSGMKKLEAVIFDWAGTTVDYGCFAPVQAFAEVFKAFGIEPTMEEVREPMGMLKRDHIKAMLAMPRIRTLWEEKYGRPSGETDIDSLYQMFEGKLMSILESFTDIKPGVLETVKILREKGISIGSTTGYTDGMMEIVVKKAEEHGYKPDAWFSPDSTNKLGRPYPYLSLIHIYSYMRVSIVMKDGCTNYDPALGSIHFGEKENREGHYSERVMAVKEVFDRCGITGIIDPDMIKGIWFKFMCNVGENLTCALLGIPFGAFQRSRHANAIRKQAMREVMQIAVKQGIDLSEEDMEKQEETLRGLPFLNLSLIHI